MKKLIIAPHVDDDVLGCGGILDEDCFVIYCGLDETSVITDRPSEQERIDEIHSVMSITHHNYKILDTLLSLLVSRIAATDKPKTKPSQI